MTNREDRLTFGDMILVTYFLYLVGCFLCYFLA